MNPELLDHPVFICGHPKSGTSLLRSLLDSHPQLLVYPEETSFFRRYLPKASGKSLEEKLSLADETLTHIFTWNQASPPASQAGFPDRDYSTVPVEQVNRAVRQFTASQYRHDGDMLSAVLLAFGQVNGQLRDQTIRWVEKTPYNERFVAQILSWWPEALFIHVIRDPRDNYASYRRKHPDWTAEIFARSWRDSTLRGLGDQERLGREHYWMLRYEDLLQNPEEILGKVCKFLYINDDKILRIPTRNGKAWQGNSMFGEQFKSIDTSPLGRYKGSLHPLDILLTEWIAASPMNRLGYPPFGLRWKDAPLSGYWRLLKAVVRNQMGDKSP